MSDYMIRKVKSWWLQGLRALFRGEVASAHTPSDAVARDRLWRGLERTMLFEHLNPAELARLQRLMQVFLAEKNIVGAQGYEPDECDLHRLAAQACLPVLYLDLRCYGRFVDVILYPDAFVAPRAHVDEAGVLTQWQDVLSGEAMDDGPVVLSAPNLSPPVPGDRECLVIHEFTHKLDQYFRLSDSPMARGSSPPAILARELAQVYDDFSTRVQELEQKLPADLDPESIEADAWYADLPLDPYAATDAAECLAVSAEAFFCADARLARHYPRLDEALSGFFRQRPGRSNR
ncbi:MAG: zinc-dependent peptidase [Burkholderiaceae bacterium]